MHVQLKPFHSLTSAAVLILTGAVIGCGGQSPEGSSNRAGVRLSGLVSDLAGGCPDTSFKVRSKRVVTDGASAFVDRSCSDLRNGASVEVQGGWRSDGSLAARKVRPPEDASQLELRGTIAGVSGSCPNLAFSIGSQRVLTDASTRFREVACSVLRNGQSIEVHGTRQADGIVVARDLEPNVEPEEIEVLGALRNLGGSCPNLTFSVGSDAFIASGDTRFRTPCSGLRAGQFVEVEGARSSNGSILVRQIKIEDEAQDAEQLEVELHGSIGSLAGGCPDLTFNVRGRTVRTNSSTSFDRIACAGLRNGISVEVKGAAQPDQSVRATRVKRED